MNDYILRFDEIIILSDHEIRVESSDFDQFSFILAYEDNECLMKPDFEKIKGASDYYDDSYRVVNDTHDIESRLERVLKKLYKKGIISTIYEVIISEAIVSDITNFINGGIIDDEEYQVIKNENKNNKGERKMKNKIGLIFDKMEIINNEEIMVFDTSKSKRTGFRLTSVGDKKCVVRPFYSPREEMLVLLIQPQYADNMLRLYSNLKNYFGANEEFLKECNASIEDDIDIYEDIWISMSDEIRDIINSMYKTGIIKNDINKNKKEKENVVEEYLADKPVTREFMENSRRAFLYSPVGQVAMFNNYLKFVITNSLPFTEKGDVVLGYITKRYESGFRRFINISIEMSDKNMEKYVTISKLGGLNIKENNKKNYEKESIFYMDLLVGDDNPTENIYKNLTSFFGKLKSSKTVVINENFKNEGYLRALSEIIYDRYQRFFKCTNNEETLTDLKDILK